MSSTNNVRIYLALALFASVVFAPPYITAVFAFALAARWRAWEVIAAGICMDLLWLPAGIGFSGVTLPFATIITTIAVFGLEPLRRQLLT